MVDNILAIPAILDIDPFFLLNSPLVLFGMKSKH